MSYIIVNKKVQKVVFDFHCFDTHHMVAIMHVLLYANMYN